MVNLNQVKRIDDFLIKVYNLTLSELVNCKMYNILQRKVEL